MTNKQKKLNVESTYNVFFLYGISRCVTEMKYNNKFISFSQTQQYFIWRQVSVIRPLSEHLYIKFKTGYM